MSIITRRVVNSGSSFFIKGVIILVKIIQEMYYNEYLTVDEISRALALKNEYVNYVIFNMPLSVDIR